MTRRKGTGRPFALPLCVRSMSIIVLKIAFPYWWKIAIMERRALSAGLSRMATAFLYHRVSTNVQETKEQVRGNRQYAEENGIKVLTEYGDFGKRHHAHKRPNFQRMLADMPDEARHDPGPST